MWVKSTVLKVVYIFFIVEVEFFSFPIFHRVKILWTTGSFPYIIFNIWYTYKSIEIYTPVYFLSCRQFKIFNNFRFFPFEVVG